MKTLPELVNVVLRPRVTSPSQILTAAQAQRNEDD